MGGLRETEEKRPPPPRAERMLCKLHVIVERNYNTSRRIINLSPVMVIPEEQPAQPALPIQPEGMRVVCGHCGNTFLVGKLTDRDKHSQPAADVLKSLCC
ncbi:hypothetical protein CHARACLAT_033619 [Characodon lateralis]|uniref:Phosphatidylinositol-4,5-bisphosphate 4-phosphatase n=1 Tax=Characodon lateralis TaxID=208331 RepID=A0ABU7D2U7_9TELE|nr:hypothetical protein [Characodon lateralis]